jgi:hypothetical protein
MPSPPVPPSKVPSREMVTPLHRRLVETPRSLSLPDLSAMAEMARPTPQRIESERPTPNHLAAERATPARPRPAATTQLGLPAPEVPSMPLRTAAKRPSTSTKFGFTATIPDEDLASASEDDGGDDEQTPSRGRRRTPVVQKVDESREPQGIYRMSRSGKAPPVPREELGRRAKTPLRGLRPATPPAKKR